MNKVTALVAGIALATSNMANANLLNFTGDIEYHNDVVSTYFTLDSDATNVRVWTDSFKSGENFDPITALWSGDGELLSENDDDENVDPATQTYYDSGFTLATLSAGDYIFTVATYANFAGGDTLDDGFVYDDQSPIALEDWNQPANDANMGTFWSVWLDGVSSASNPGDPSDPSDPSDPGEPGGPVFSVPEPGTLGLMALGLLGLSVRRVRKA
ncbi:MAG: DVUA0089 family protein [Marinobacter sp.]